MAPTRAEIGNRICMLSGGSYWIGSSLSPNAGPKHLRNFIKDVWLDESLITWDCFKKFVRAGGYSTRKFWQLGSGCIFPESTKCLSVDDRCEMVRELTLKAEPFAWEFGRGNLPVFGLNWFEAAAICNFYGARLPYETEWEAAQGKKLLRGTMKGAVRMPAQEWCLDGYVSRYWRADFKLRGRIWQLGQRVVVRGHSKDEPVLGTKARRSVNPISTNAGRSFRRVWDEKPA